MAARHSERAKRAMPHAASDRETLSDYWRRLDTLSDKEWAEFYGRVRMALRRCPASELSALPDSRDNYIAEFFAEKIFFKAQRKQDEGIQTISGGALCGFFRRYLIDELRRRKRDEPLDDDIPEVNPVVPDDPVDSLLRQIGGHEALAKSIEGFLAHLEDWALLMLRGHFCADDSIPMSKLCKGIPAYHYKAQKLGIAVKRNAADFLGYEHTRIGQWIKGLGLDIVPENHSAIRHLLGMICLEAAAAAEGSP